MIWRVRLVSGRKSSRSSPTLRLVPSRPSRYSSRSTASPSTHSSRAACAIRLMPPTSPRTSSSKSFATSPASRGDASLRTWIYRIALHEISNQKRWWCRHKKQELTIDAPHQDEDGDTFCLADALAASDASPFDNAVRSQLRARVEAALLSLPEAFREVVILREIEGFGYEEIAEIPELQPRHGQKPPHPRSRRASRSPAGLRSTAKNIESRSRASDEGGRMIRRQPTPNSCRDVRRQFSPYLDGGLNGQVRCAIGRAPGLLCILCCGVCLLASSPAIAGWPWPCGVRQKISRRSFAMPSAPSARKTIIFPPWAVLLCSGRKHWRPAALRVAGGMSIAAVLLGSTMWMYTPAITVQANDDRLAHLTNPRYLYSSVPLEALQTRHDLPVLVEAKVDTQGRVYDYTIVAGPADQTVRRRVEQNLLTSIFQAGHSLRRPCPGERGDYVYRSQCSRGKSAMRFAMHFWRHAPAASLLGGEAAHSDPVAWTVPSGSKM